MSILASGGARATLQCVGNSAANCGDGTSVPVGSSAGLVPYQAVINRDVLVNNDWWTYNGYIQDSYSKAMAKASQEDLAMAAKMLEHWVQGRRD